MKKRTKSKLLVWLVSIAAAFLLGGCSLGQSLDDVLETNNLVAKVTYYSNGGSFEGTPDKKDLYFKSGKKALNIGVVTPTNGSAEIERKNYVFDGWYFAVLDDENNPVFEDEQNKIYKLGDKVDFSVPLQEGDHWILVAKWTANVKVNVQLVCDAEVSIPVKVKEGEEAISYKNGDVVAIRTYDTKDEVVNPGDGKAPFNVAGKEYTFVEYYADEACTSLVQWPLKKQDADVTIYAKYIQGDWGVLRTPRDVTNMFSSITSGKRYWVTRNIDVSGSKISAKTVFDGEIQGNGYKISNLNVQKSKITAGSTVSLFGDIQATAVIENLTLDGLTLTYSVQSAPISVYFAFTSIAEGAKITNVKLSGVMTITKAENHLITTLSGEYENCLYGGYTSDAEYIEKTEGKGLIVEGNAKECIIVKSL